MPIHTFPCRRRSGTPERDPSCVDPFAGSSSLSSLMLPLLLGSVQFAAADPDPANVPPHRHFIETATGALVEAGPRVCDNPDLQDAFNQFHDNVHFGAPGLDNHQGAEIIRQNCT